MDRVAPTWVEILRAYQVPLTPQAALTYLAQQAPHCGILGCYRLFFPDQWTTSVAPLLSFPLDLEWRREARTG